MSAKKKPNGKAPAPKPATPGRQGPPYVLTEAEEADIRLRHGFTEESVDYAQKVCSAGLFDLEYELRALAENVFSARPDSVIWTEDEAREYATEAAAHARSLCDISNRMMRFAGRLEAYADCVAHLNSADDMVEEFKAGKLGGPPFTLTERRAEYEAARAGSDGAE